MQIFGNPNAEQTLLRFMRSIKGVGSETGKREHFSTLLGELFPGVPEVRLMHRGAETALKL